MKLVSAHRFLCLAAVIVVSMACSHAQAAPKMTIDSLEKNAGTVWKGTPAQFEFTVKNEGDAPLEMDVKPGCGCTVAQFDKSIEPAKEGHIHATLNTDHISAPVTKILTVHSNDPKEPKEGVMLRISVTVRPYIEIQPQYRPYFYLYHGDEDKFTYTFSANDDIPLEIKSVRSSLPQIETKLLPVVVDAAGRRSYRLEVTLPKDAPVGPVNASIAVVTNHPKEPTVYVNMIGMIQREITFNPSFVHFGTLKPGDKKQVDVKIAKRTGEFKITSVTPDSEQVKVVIYVANTQEELTTPTPAGKAFRLLLKYDGGWPKGNIVGKITIATDDPDQPELIVQFACNVI